ncbi:unnamed protein product, partial [Prorocentrum cordatum]
MPRRPVSARLFGFWGRATRSAQIQLTGTCGRCGPHVCTAPDEGEREMRGSIWYRPQGGDADVDWDAFARVPTSVYDGVAPAGFLDFYRLARANAAAVSDRGSAIFRTHARLNHSCEPSCLCDFPALAAAGAGGAGCPAAVAVLAEREIAAGQEVCISYLGRDEGVED